MELTRIMEKLSVCKVTDISDIDLTADNRFFKELRSFIGALFPIVCRAVLFRLNPFRAAMSQRLWTEVPRFDHDNGMTSIDQRRKVRIVLPGRLDGLQRCLYNNGQSRE